LYIGRKFDNAVEFCSLLELQRQITYDSLRVLEENEMEAETTERSRSPVPRSQPLTPSEAITAWNDLNLSSTALMRLLVGYDQWRLPITSHSAQAMRTSNAVPEPWLYRDADDRKRLFLFSSNETLAHYESEAKLEQSQSHTSTSGVSVFTRDLSSLEALHLDPLSPISLTLGRELFPRLNVIADAVRVERALIQLRGGATRVANQLTAVRSFPAYHVGYRDSGDGPRFALAPDPRNRFLAAVFTLNDCFEQYLHETGATNDSVPLRRAVISGERLFAELLEAGLDGIVFNCCGPVAPVAFAPAFARLVLEVR
jgi:hypothetical protein